MWRARNDASPTFLLGAYLVALNISYKKFTTLSHPQKDKMDEIPLINITTPDIHFTMRLFLYFIINIREDKTMNINEYIGYLWLEHNNSDNTDITAIINEIIHNETIRSLEI